MALLFSGGGVVATRTWNVNGRPAGVYGAHGPSIMTKLVNYQKRSKQRQFNANNTLQIYLKDPSLVADATYRALLSAENIIGIKELEYLNKHGRGIATTYNTAVKVCNLFGDYEKPDKPNDLGKSRKAQMVKVIHWMIKFDTERDSNYCLKCGSAESLEELCYAVYNNRDLHV